MRRSRNILPNQVLPFMFETLDLFERARKSSRTFLRTLVSMVVATAYATLSTCFQAQENNHPPGKSTAKELAYELAIQPCQNLDDHPKPTRKEDSSALSARQNQCRMPTTPLMYRSSTSLPFLENYASFSWGTLPSCTTRTYLSTIRRS